MCIRDRYITLRSSSLIPNSGFKIGMILPLTGAAADYGKSIERCVDLAKEDNPENFTNIVKVKSNV